MADSANPPKAVRWWADPGTHLTLGVTQYYLLADGSRAVVDEFGTLVSVRMVWNDMRSDFGDRALDKSLVAPEEAESMSDELIQPEEVLKAGKGPKRGLLPVHHPNRDFFLCDLFDYSMKDDGVSMEAPIFTLATKPDLSVWAWKSKDGNREITVTPSVLGRATQHDKDLLIYVVSQMTEALNRGRPDANNRTVRFRVYDYLVATNKQTGGKEYQRLEDALERLSGTRIKTNIKTGGQRVKDMFGLIEKVRIIEKSPDEERMIAVEVTMSEWLFNAVQAHEVLTINPDYFRLRKPIERRLYELARKHCGDQAFFVIGTKLLQEKCGSKSALPEFRRNLREIIQCDTLPDYRMVLGEDDKVTFFNRDPRKMAKSIALSNKVENLLADAIDGQ